MPSLILFSSLCNIQLGTSHIQSARILLLGTVASWLTGWDGWLVGCFGCGAVLGGCQAHSRRGEAETTARGSKTTVGVDGIREVFQCTSVLNLHLPTPTTTSCRRIILEAHSMAAPLRSCCCVLESDKKHSRELVRWTLSFAPTTTRDARGGCRWRKLPRWCGSIALTAKLSSQRRSGRIVSSDLVCLISGLLIKVLAVGFFSCLVR